MAQFPVATYSDLGGIQTGKSRVDFKPRDALFAIGGYFDTRGAFIKRKGGVKYNTTEIEPLQGIYDFRTPSLEKIILTAGGNVYDGNAGSPLLIQSGLDATEFTIFETMRERAFYVNGVDPLFMYDGTTVTEVGIVAPPSGMVATPQAAGGTLASGTYQVAVTFSNDSDPEPDNFIESNPSPFVSTVVVGPTGSIDLSSIPISSDPEVTSREIYVTFANGAVLFFFDRIADNTTTTFTITDDPTGRLLEFDHDPPPVGLVAIEEHRNRMFGILGNRLYWSKEFQPWYWPQGEQDELTLNFLEIEGGDNTALIKYFDVLFTFKDNEIWTLSGTNEVEFRLDLIRADIFRGAVSKRGVKVIENYCYFIGRNSIYRTDGITVWDVGHPLQEFFDQVSPNTEFNVNRAAIEDSILDYDEERSLMLMPLPTGGSTDNNIVFAMDTKSGTISQEQQQLTFDWCIYVNGEFNVRASAFVLENGFYRWYRGDENGFVFRMNTLDGDGAQITSLISSATATTLTDTSQSITVDLHKSLKIYILDEFGQIDQERTVISNTADTWTIDVAWDTTPSAGDTYAVGGIKYKYQHFWDNYQMPSHSKRLRFIRPRFETTGQFPLCIGFNFDFSFDKSYKDVILVEGGSAWDVDLWDDALWDGLGIDDAMIPIRTGKVHRWSSISVENNTSGQEILYYGHDKIFKPKTIRRPRAIGIAGSTA